MKLNMITTNKSTSPSSKKLRKYVVQVLLFLMVFSFTGCSKNSKDISANEGNNVFNFEMKSEDPQEAFDEFTKLLLCDLLADNTLDKNTLLANPEAYGYSSTEVSFPLATDNDIEYYKSVLEHLKTFDYDALTYDQQNLYQSILFRFEDYELLEKLSLYNRNLDISYGVHVQLPIILSEYNFNEKEDIDEYLKLLQFMPGFFESIVTYETQRSNAGLFMSDRQLDQVISSCQSFINDPDNNFLIQIYESNIQQLTYLTEEEKNSYITEGKEAVLTYFIPAYETLITGLEELRGTGVNEAGLSGLEFGKEYYEYYVQIDCGTSMTIEDMKLLLEEKMSQYYLQVMALVTKDTSLYDKITTLEPTYTDNEEILSRLKEVLNEKYPEFDDFTCNIAYVHESLQDTLSPAFVIQPQVDNINDSTIYINRNPLYENSDLFSTLAHEGYPGHLYQMKYFASKNKSPLFVMLQSTGYLESWSVWNELNSYSWCGYDENLAQLIKLNTLYTYCALSYVDILVNYEGISKDEALSILSGYGFIGYEEYYYNLMIDSPANTLPYTIGYLSLEELVNTAKEALGDGYNETEFYDFYLSGGPLPFPVIEERLNQWIESQKIK